MVSEGKPRMVESPYQCLLVKAEAVDAEHMEASPLPCNAAARLQARVCIV